MAERPRPVGRISPVGQLRPMTTPQRGGQLPIVFTQRSGVVNLPGAAAVQQQQESISNAADIAKQQALTPIKVGEARSMIPVDVEKKVAEQEALNLSSEAGQRFNQATNVMRLTEQLRDAINSGRNILTAGVFDTELQGLMNNLNSNIVQLRSGAASSDKERAFLKKIVPVWNDVVLNLYNGKAKAVQINKLGQIFAEAKGLATTIGGSKRLDETLKIQKEAMQEFTQQPADIEQSLNQRLQELQQRLGQIQGAK